MNAQESSNMRIENISGRGIIIGKAGAIDKVAVDLKYVQNKYRKIVITISSHCSNKLTKNWSFNTYESKNPIFRNIRR